MARTVEYGCFFMKTSVIFFRGTTHFLPNVKRYAVSPSYICRQKKSRKFMKENVKETLDFGTMEVSRLFRKLFFPTLLGMVFSAVFVITDGIFVGRGIGSDALAAVNITAPLFLINTGIGLMFGVGASVAASIALSRGRERLARAYITQSVYVGSLLLILLWGIVLCFSLRWPVFSAVRSVCSPWPWNICTGSCLSLCSALCSIRVCFLCGSTGRPVMPCSAMWCPHS